MAKLTEQERLSEKKVLKDRLIAAIERTAKGITDGEIRHTILEACSELELIQK